MTRAKLGILVVGQSPRPEVEQEFHRLVPSVQIEQRGCLDGLNREDISALAPSRGEVGIFTRLPNGEGVSLSKAAVVRHGTAQLDRLEQSGARAVVALCTGEFPDWEGRPILLPSRIIRSFVTSLQSGGHLGVLSPLQSQIPATEKRWAAAGYRTTAVALSPNATAIEAEAASAQFAEAAPDIILLDCVSYTLETKSIIRKATGRPVVLAITAVARTAAELIEG